MQATGYFCSLEEYEKHLRRKNPNMEEAAIKAAAKKVIDNFVSKQYNYKHIERMVILHDNK